MTPVAQSKLAQQALQLGNCFAACVASLIDADLWMVPAFEDARHGVSAASLADQWLRRFCGQTLIRTDGHAVEAMPEFYIANGRSPRGGYHSVIYSAGALVHDPHPLGGGLIDVEWTWHLSSLAPSGQPSEDQ